MTHPGHRSAPSPLCDDAGHEGEDTHPRLALYVERGGELFIDVGTTLAAVEVGHDWLLRTKGVCNPYDPIIGFPPTDRGTQNSGRSPAPTASGGIAVGAVSQWTNPNQAFIPSTLFPVEPTLQSAAGEPKRSAANLRQRAGKQTLKSYGSGWRQCEKSAATDSSGGPF